MFAALNRVEPPILELVTVKLVEGNRRWKAERLPLVEERVRARQNQLVAGLGDAAWLGAGLPAGVRRATGD
jgi:glutathione S-transferase